MKSQRWDGHAAMKVRQWNRFHPVGTQVVVTLDDGRVLKTQVKYPASLLGGYIPVVWVYGFTGCHRLDKVRPEGRS